jgi:phosphorylase/glycogen(starch) synthase
MITDYLNRFYLPQEKRGKLLKADDFKLAKDLTTWKQKVRNVWNKIEVLDVDMPDIAKEQLGIGQIYPISITLDKVDPDVEFGLEMVFASGADENNMKVVHAEPFSIAKRDGSKVTYSVSLSLNYPGVFRFGLRIFPSNPLLPNKQDFPLLKWI